MKFSTVLLTRKIVNFLTKASNQRERVKTHRAEARIGRRSYRPVVLVAHRNRDPDPASVLSYSPT